MLNEKIAKLLNKQIGLELFSAYLYWEMANYYEIEGLNGFANWFSVQTKEEQDHALIMRNYLIENDDKVVLGSIESPSTEFKTFDAALSMALEHEKIITASINAIYSEAAEFKDYRTQKFLEWFISEQGEEEKNVSDLITKFKLYASDSKGLYMMNQELLARTYQMPAILANGN